MTTSLPFTPVPTVPVAKRGRKSRVATHPDRASIELALSNGVPLKALAKRYGVSPDVLSRYRRRMPPGLLAALRVRPVQSDEELARVRELEGRSLLDHLLIQRARMYANADASSENGDLAGERAAIAQAGRATERIADLLRDLGTAIRPDWRPASLASVPGYHFLRAELTESLRPFPDARAVAAGALQRAEAAAMDGMAIIEGHAQRVRERVEQRGAA